MRYMLDTNICIYLVLQSFRDHPGLTVENWLD